MLYNDDFFKRAKTIVRCCLDIVIDVDLEAKFCSIYVWNVARSSVLWRLELELKVTKMVESKKANFCDVLYLDIVFDVDSNKWHSVFFNVVHCIFKSESRIFYGSLFARASNFSTLRLIPIHPLPRERKLKRNHVAAKLANHFSGNLTFGVGSRAQNWLQSTQKCLRVWTWYV